MEIVGCLIYGAVTTRMDIANAVGQLGRVMNKPGKAHLNAAKRVLRYIVGSLDRGIIFQNKDWTPPGLDRAIPPKEIIMYSDSDWQGDQDSRRSTTGYATFMAGGLISYKSTLVKMQVLSSAEGEYTAISDAGQIGRAHV